MDVCEIGYDRISSAAFRDGTVVLNEAVPHHAEHRSQTACQRMFVKTYRGSAISIGGQCLFDRVACWTKPLRGSGTSWFVSFQDSSLLHLLSSAIPKGCPAA